MAIRNLAPKDIPSVLALGSRMHQESVYREFDYNAQKFGRLLCQYLLEPDAHFAMVAECGSKITGVLLGYTAEHYFGYDRLAADTLWYVAPEHRGSKAALQLLFAFQDWAKTHGAAVVNIGVSSGITADKTGTLLTKLGYADVGGIYKRRVVV